MVDLPIVNGDFLVRKLLVYQRVSVSSFVPIFFLGVPRFSKVFQLWQLLKIAIDSWFTR